MRVVLIITPDAPLGENIRELLEIEGYEVHVSHDVDETHRELLKDIPQVVVCDELNLNGSFNSILKEIGENSPKAKLLLLNKDGDHHRYKHVTYSLAMPFTPESFTQKIEKAFQELN